MAIYKRKTKSNSGKVSESWCVEVLLPDGRRIKRSIGKVGIATKAMAREEETRLKKSIRRGEYGSEQIVIPTLNEIKDEYISYIRDVKGNRSWRRSEELLRPICKIYGNKKLSDITIKDIEEFKVARLKEVSTATTNRSISVLRHLINQSKRRNKFRGDNVVSISGLLTENNQVQRVLIIEEENRLLCESTSLLRSIIIAALNTALRRGELLTLSWADVDLDTNLLTVRQTNSKSKKERRVPINSILRKLLVELKLKSGESEYVFNDENGRPIKSIRSPFNNACKRAGLEGLRFHDLRHTVATRMVESGTNIVVVSKILGHSDIKTTMRYAHPEDSLKDALESLGNFGKNTTKIATNENS